MDKNIAKLLLSQIWIFARTMPQNPHWYTLRRNWEKDSDFVKCVTHIRENGHREIFKGVVYTVMNLNGFKYWTMGAPINKRDGSPCTILINRAKVNYAADYDKIADDYDRIYDKDEFKKEEIELLKMVPDSNDVVDIGCGTGLYLRYREPIKYIGIDISQKMIDKLKSEHYLYSNNSTICSSFMDFVPIEDHDLYIGLFGVGSYFNPAEIEKLKNTPGRKFIMFYSPGYKPLSHKGINPKMINPADFKISLNKWGNYLIWIE